MQKDVPVGLEGFNVGVLMRISTKCWNTRARNTSLRDFTANETTVWIKSDAREIKD